MGTIAAPPPAIGVAFGRGHVGGPGDAPIVTFEAKRAFHAFADSLTAEQMNRATRVYDSNCSGNRSGFDDNAVSKRGGVRAADGSGSSVSVRQLSGAARGEAVVRAVRDIAERSHTLKGGATQSQSRETPLQAFERDFAAQREAKEALAKTLFHTRPAAIPLGQDMRRAAAMDCGVSGSRYPNGPYAEFEWVFDRESRYVDNVDAATAKPFRRHFPQLKPVHLERSLGEPVDLRALVEAERTVTEQMRAERAGARRYDECHKKIGPHDKPPRRFAETLKHKPGHLANARPVTQQDGSLDADGRLVVTKATSLNKTEKKKSAFDEFEKIAIDYAAPRANPRLAGAGSSGGGFFAPNPDADGVATRGIKTCSAYATRLIASGVVGGVVVPVDGGGKRLGNPLIGATAAAHVRAGTPLGAFQGVALEQATRFDEKNTQQRNETKNTARRAYTRDIHSTGGFGWDRRRKENALAEASAESFGVPRQRRSDTVTDLQKERTATPGTMLREYSALTMGTAQLVTGEVWTPGGAGGLTQTQGVNPGARFGNWTWRNTRTPQKSSLEMEDVAGLPRHSAARARVRREDSMRKLSTRPSATFV
jgi:hypothetical protein